MPPGGPPDVAAPQIVSINPDSGAVGVKPKEVVFRFDEVVSERPPAATTLGDLFLISPRDGVPNASWHRDAIGVKPAHGWRANTPYTVIMMKGLADLRGNVRNTGATTFFSTGTTIPRTTIAGHVFDWVSGSPASGALIESFVPPDTVHPYVALADSNGAFVIEHVPPARYTVRAYVDRNRNLTVDPSEPWDSLSISLADSVRTDLVIFTHDTIAPRIRDVRAADSLTLQVSFDKPVDPAQTLTAANFAIIAPDSSPVPIVSAGPTPKDTAARVNPAAGIIPAGAANPPAGAKPPTGANPPAGANPSGRVNPPAGANPVTGVTPGAAPRPAGAAPRPAAAVPARGRAAPAGRPDTLLVPKPVMPRPVPISEATIKLQHPLTPKLAYHVRAIGIRGLLGRIGDSEHIYTQPAPAPPPKVAPAAKPTAVPPTTPPPVNK